MEIVILAIGKTSTKYIIEGIRDYSERLRHYINWHTEVISDLRKGKSMPISEQKQREGERMLAAIQPSDMVILLDENGREYTSTQFSQRLEKIMVSGRKRIIFCIGGPYGFSEDMYHRADAKISLSRLTFNHEMVRLFFIEQLYRAFTILRGESYHHD